MRYSGITKADREQMLRVIGVPTTEALLSSVPEDVRVSSPLDIRGPLGELELLRELEERKVAPPRVSLVGGGLYSHYIPKTVDSLAARSEWVTSYTPYQPEVAQGTLTMYYEFQTYVCMLTGQEIANGGMYDGSTALAEAVLMGLRIRKKSRRVYVSEGVHPMYREVLATYLRYQDAEMVLMPLDPVTGRTSVNVSPEDQGDAAGVVIQNPNYFGVIEDGEGVSGDAFRIGVCTEAQSLALLKPLACDVMVGEMQSLGIPIQLGGPTSGFFATKRAYVRNTPGRLVGLSQDRRGREALCITLATREQFIRREKATSNICTASGLMCLRATIYLSLLGAAGLKSVARQSARATQAFQSALLEVGGKRVYSGANFNEFVVDLSAAPDLYASLKTAGFLLGIPLGPERPHQYLVALTEMHYPVIESLIQEVKKHAHDS
jgi:glycine dehydrogenase subunit 1